MEFGNLKYLYLLWLIPALIAFYIYAFRAKDKAVDAFCGLKLAGRLMPGVSRERQKSKAAMLIVAMLLMIFALTRPKWGFQWEDIKRKGVDIVIVLDVSKSMLAEDIPPNRLERAKRKIHDLLQILEGDRIGLVSFSGLSFIQCPLTLDYSAASVFMECLDTDLIPVPGPDIDKAIRKAMEAFKAEDKKSKAIIVMSDGENWVGDAVKAAQDAKEAGITIFTMGIGTETGGPIPLKDDSEEVKKNADGEVIVTKLDEDLLKKIAMETGGAYVRSVTNNLDLEEIYLKGIRQRIEQKELKSARLKRWEERFQWFLLAAFVLIILESLYSERRRKN